MRSNKGMGRKQARAKRLLQELRVEETGLAPCPSTYHMVLAWRLATKPNFRKSKPAVVVTQASANEKAREKKAAKDLKAGRGGQKVSRLAVRSAHRRKVKAEKRTCKCVACHKGEV